MTVRVCFEAAPSEVCNQMRAWIRWAVRKGALPEGLVLEAAAELALRHELRAYRLNNPSPANLGAVVTSFWGLPVRVGEGLRPREVVIECAYGVGASEQPNRAASRHAM